MQLNTTLFPYYFFPPLPLSNFPSCRPVPGMSKRMCKNSRAFANDTITAKLLWVAFSESKKSTGFCVRTKLNRSTMSNGRDLPIVFEQNKKKKKKKFPLGKLLFSLLLFIFSIFFSKCFLSSSFNIRSLKFLFYWISVS